MPDRMLNIESTYGRLFQKEPPDYEIIQPSLITVLKAYSETNLTNLLGYLLKGDHHLLLKRIFLRAIIDVIDMAQDFPPDEDIESYLSEIKIDIEYATAFGRIDILIRRDHHSESKRWAIIIENKIYHTLNNDLDDYYFTVTSRFRIRPRNVVVVILALRDTIFGLHPHIGSQVLLHSDFNENIVQLYRDHLNEFNDRSALLIINEYIRHINDLYLTSTTSANRECFNFLYQNRLLLSELCRERPDWTYQNLNEKNREYLFTHLHKADRLCALQRKVMEEMNSSFEHYLLLTGRNVSGNSPVRYFRGSGTSFSLIRYQLNYQAFFRGESSEVTFSVWLNGKMLTLIGLDQTDVNLVTALANVGVRYDITGNEDWEMISASTYVPHNADINDILKENLHEGWQALEDLLGKALDDYQTRNYYSGFKEHITAEEYHVEERNEGVFFTTEFLDFLLRYKVAFIAPDYTEIILYVNINHWEECRQTLSELDAVKKFILFDKRDAYHLPELRDEKTQDSVMNFEALVKRSYRELDLVKAQAKLVEELALFKAIEQRLSDKYFE